MILHSREIDTVGQLASMSADEVSTLPMRGGKHKYRVLTEGLSVWLEESKWTLKESQYFIATRLIRSSPGMKQSSEAKEDFEEDEPTMNHTDGENVQEACEEDGKKYRISCSHLISFRRSTGRRIASSTVRRRRQQQRALNNEW